MRSWAIERDIDAEFIVSGELLPGQVLEGAKVLSIVPALKGRCVREGVFASKGDPVLVCDADMPVAVADLDALLKRVAGADMAVGQRSPGAGRGWARRVASTVFRTLARAMVDLPRDADPQCGTKVYRRAAARRVFARQTVEGLAYEVEVMRRAYRMGLRVVNVPVHWRSESSIVSLWRDAPRMLVDLLRVAAMWGNYEGDV